MEPTFGERAADFVAYNIGRWAFVLTQTALIAAWMWTNGFGMDPPPWIGLNLMLSLQAAYTGPVLLISANRADRIRSNMLKGVDRHTDLIAKHTNLMDQHTKETHGAIREAHDSILTVQREHARMLALLEDIERQIADLRSRLSAAPSPPNQGSSGKPTKKGGR